MAKNKPLLSYTLENLKQHPNYKDVVTTIESISDKNKYDKDFILALATKESGVQPLRKNDNPKSTAVGLYQINNPTYYEHWEKHGKKFDRFNADQSTNEVIGYLNKLSNKINTLDFSAISKDKIEEAKRNALLLAYNRGFVGAKRVIAKQGFFPKDDYINKVNKYYNNYKQERNMQNKVSYDMKDQNFNIIDQLVNNVK